MITRVSNKLILAVAGVAIAIISIFSYLLLQAHERQLVAELERSAHQLSETVKSSTRYDMLLNQRESVHRIINTIGQQEGIEKVRIFNKDGVIIYSTDSLESGRMVDKKTEACYRCHLADQPLERLPISERTRVFQSAGRGATLGIINPIYNEASCWQADCHAHSETQKVLGVLDITMSLAEVEAGLRASKMRLLLFAVVAITAVSLIIYLLVNRIVLQPVNEIVAATKHVAAGDLNYTIALDKPDEIGLLAKSFNDMTRRLAETQRQLYQSDKLASVGRLAAGVAHEINNPLTGVLTYSTFLLKRADTHPEIKEDLEVIVRETMRCREIVRGLLDFARQSRPEKRASDINEVVKRSVRILQNQFARHHVRVEPHLDDSLPLVSMDVDQIQQVLVNLLLNANDAMAEKGGTLTIITSRATLADQPAAPDAQQYVQIQVSDTGCGIPPEHLQKIFEPFFSTKGQKGNGLGLAIVWGIVEKHNGRITVQSEVGKGTTFTVFLPLQNKVDAKPRYDVALPAASPV
ncbi:MAG: ATP-binding protein [candidate division KSB1 bacterium]|nr:ATP-binding protein [candidate division KSB1 bacterium]MDZ7274280.1 ATP-binding protein [candidate division KSB1 bacterium]MDZ7287198.1 ATP-binding protein [candidate division KSB1 bacterium]MDZ7296877.1 ATP-binding protein [candidate division KSB1 bacterium]MDZ7306018.1 ATP-binding protein [candidate division KSB1 bacterium]